MLVRAHSLLAARGSAAAHAGRHAVSPAVPFDPPTWPAPGLTPVRFVSHLTTAADRLGEEVRRRSEMKKPLLADKEAVPFLRGL